MLDKLRTLLGLSGDLPPAEALMLEMLERKARKICRIPAGEALPEALQDAIVEICLARCRVQNYGSSEVPQVVTGASDNGQSVTYKALVSEAAGRGSADLSPEEIGALQYWRRLF